MGLLRRNGEWYAAKVGDDLVMMSAQTGAYLGLSEVGARVWELVERPMSLAEVCTALMAEYDVAPDVCRAEVERFVGELVDHGALSIDGT